MRKLFLASGLLSLAALLSSCDTVIDNRIPAAPVAINLNNAGLWNTYGVAGFGHFRYFRRQNGTPAGFPYTQTTFTGFGGVLLIGGMDPFTTDTQIPLAYDLACPVECNPNIIVSISPDNFEAVCPECGSHYDVTMAGGAPISGPAAIGNRKYGLQRYSCLPSGMDGYYITR